MGKTTTKSPSFADLFEKLEKNQKEREEWVKNNPPPDLSIREALVIASELHETGHDASTIFNVLFPNEYAECDIAAKDVLEHAKPDATYEMIDIWRHKLFNAKMFRQEKLSSWRQRIAHLLSDPERKFLYSDGPLVSTLPRYHEYEERYIRLGNDYKVLERRTNKNVHMKNTLTYIEHWTEKNKDRGRRTIFAFKTEDDYLVLWPMSARVASLSADFLIQLLKFTDTFSFEGSCYTKIVDDNKYALQFDYVKSFEAIK